MEQAVKETKTTKTRISRIKRALAVGIGLGLIAFGTIKVEERINRNLEREGIRSEAIQKLKDIYAISPELRARLRVKKGKTESETVMNAFNAVKELGIVYKREYGKSVRDTLDSGEGNCVSMSRLLVTILRENGIRARMVEVIADENGDPNLHSEVAVYAEGVPSKRKYSPNGKREDFVLFDPSRGEIGRSDAGIRILAPIQEVANYWIDLALSTENDDKSIELLEKASRVDPENIIALVNLAGRYMKKEQYDVAEKILKNAMKIDKTKTAEYYYLEFLYSRGRFDEMDEITEKD